MILLQNKRRNNLAPIYLSEYFWGLDEAIGSTLECCEILFLCEYGIKLLGQGSACMLEREHDTNFKNS